MALKKFHNFGIKFQFGNLKKEHYLTRSVFDVRVSFNEVLFNDFESMIRKMMYRFSPC